MAELKGEVAYINERTITSKKNGRKFQAYSIKLKLENGELSGNLDCGFDKPAVAQGDYVAVQTHAEGQYEKVDRISAAQRPVAAKPAQTAVSPSGDEGGADRQTQIVLQHSQEMAIAEVDLLLRNNALPVSAATAKAGQAKRYEEIHAAIQKLTVELFFDVVSARLLDKVADAGDVELSTAALPNSNATEVATQGEDD